jgi:hypothetical protein
VPGGIQSLQQNKVLQATAYCGMAGDEQVIINKSITIICSNQSEFYEQVNIIYILVLYSASVVGRRILMLQHHQ